MTLCKRMLNFCQPVEMGPQDCSERRLRVPGKKIDVSDCCCLICCGCTRSPRGPCSDSGPVGDGLHIQVTTSCGTFSGSLTRQANNCWKGIVSLICKSQDIGNLGDGVKCRGPFDVCFLLCCGTDFPTVENFWALFATCDEGCSNLGTPTSNSSGSPSVQACSPFYLEYKGLKSILACLLCTDDIFDVVIIG